MFCHALKFVQNVEKIVPKLVREAFKNKTVKHMGCQLKLEQRKSGRSRAGQY